MWNNFTSFWKTRSGLTWLLAAFALGLLSAFYHVYSDKSGWLLTSSDIKNPSELANVIQEHKEPLSLFLWNGISDDLRKRLIGHQFFVGDNRELRMSLVKELNMLLSGNCIYSSERFPDLTALGQTTQRLLNGSVYHSKTDLMRLNRLLISEAYPSYVEKPEKEKQQTRGRLVDFKRWRPFLYVGILFIGVCLGALAWEAWRCSPLYSVGLYDAAKSIIAGPSNEESRRKFLRRNAGTFWDGFLGIFTHWHCIRDAFSAAAIALLIGLASVLPLWFFRDAPDIIEFGWQVLENPGGIFALVTGIFTLVGTFIAIKSILETRQIITTFPQLTDRLVALIKEDTREQGTGVLFLSYTPLPGAWNLGTNVKRDKENNVSVESFSPRLQKELMDSKNKVKIACLKFGDVHDGMEAFLNNFRNKKMKLGVIDDGMVTGFSNACTELRNAFKNRQVTPPSHWADRAEVFKSTIHELGNAEMPDYYIFVSSVRAIIVVPTGMPTLRHSDIEDDRINVETLGFETTDRHVISALQQEFYRFCPEGGAQTQEKGNSQLV